MEKLISFFQPSEKRIPSGEEGDRSESPTPDQRRKWSISRSGRMKQTNKKRHNVTVEHYGETGTHAEKPTSVEYHVNAPVTPTAHASRSKPEAQKKHPTEDPKTPEEEIESAFEILDKVDKS